MSENNDPAAEVDEQTVEKVTFVTYVREGSETLTYVDTDIEGHREVYDSNGEFIGVEWE